MPEPQGNLVTPVGIDVDGFPRAQGQLISFTEPLMIDLGGDAVGSNYAQSSGVVPAGEVWVLQAASIRNVDGTGTFAQIYVHPATGGYVFIAAQAAVALYETIFYVGNVLLVEGQKVSAYMATQHATDTIECAITGYKMEL